MQVQSADGVIHEFPDGTDPSVIDRAMKAYVGQQATSPQAPEKRGVMDQLLGSTGPRYQLWPEKVAREALSIPEQSIKASEEMRQGGGYNPAPAMEAASLANPALRIGRMMNTAGALRGAARSGYESTPVSELLINPTSTSKLSSNLIAEAEKKGLRPYQAGAGEVYKAANELSGLPNATSVPKGNTVFQPEISGPGYQMGSDLFVPSPVGVKDITGVRTALGSTVKSGTDPLTGELTPVAGRAQQVRGGISDYLNNIPAQDVVAGDPQLAASILRNAGADYSASKKLQIIDALMNRADLNKAAANSGKNMNTERVAIKNFILNQRNERGLSEAQAGAAEDAVRGGFVGNRARSIANQLDPSGAMAPLNTGAVGGIGYALGPKLGVDPMTAAMVAALSTRAVGKMARGVANASEERMIDKFRQSVLNESPSAKRSMAWDETQARREALAKALLFGMQAQPYQ